MSKTKDGIDAVYHEYADKIYRFLLWQSGDSLLAEDLTSEVFYRAWKHRASFQAIDNQQAWLYRTARNALTDHWRRVRPVALPEDFDPLADIDIHADAEKREAAKQLRLRVQALPDEQRTVVHLRFFEYLPVATVAAIMNKSEANIRVIQYRGLKVLQKAYESDAR